MQTFVLGLMLVAVATLDPPYVGRWKLNMLKSDTPDVSVVFEQAPGGPVSTATSAILPKATFRFDGQDYPAEFGLTVAWKQTDPRTWTMKVKQGDGTPGPDVTLTMSPDEQTLTIAMRAGSVERDRSILTRTAGRSGLVGAWQLKQMTTAVDQITELTPNGEDGVTIRLLPANAVSNARFDGKDYPFVVPGMAPDMTYAVTRTGPRSFDVVQKHSGQALGTTSYVVSDDGATLTTVSRPADGGPSMQSVYERQ